MKRIAIFCDGTWNSPTDDRTTHVHRLHQATPDTPDQVSRYLSGVGTGSRINLIFTNAINKIGGGAFGWGLSGKIRDAYRHVAEAYEPGDEILIFGFSRGAYTARSLAGMIRKAGIVSPVTDRQVRKAFDLYKQSGEDNHPDADHIHAARRHLSPRFATSDTDLTRRGDGSHLVKIAYIGIWDTVGAMGIPEPVFGPLAKLWNRRHRFHDLELSSLVASARHAVAIDETREIYDVTVWNNLDRHVDTQGQEQIGLNQGQTGPDRPFQQVWCVGDHGTVGGSGRTRPLAAITIEWIADGAQRAGLQLTPGAALTDVLPDATVDDPEQQDPGLMNKLASAWRRGPTQRADVHDSVELRLSALGRYRPPPLRAVFPQFF